MSKEAPINYGDRKETVEIFTQMERQCLNVYKSMEPFTRLKLEEVKYGIGTRAEFNP